MKFTPVCPPPSAQIVFFFLYFNYVYNVNRCILFRILCFFYYYYYFFLNV